MTRKKLLTLFFCSLPDDDSNSQGDGIGNNSNNDQCCNSSSNSDSVNDKSSVIVEDDEGNISSSATSQRRSLREQKQRTVNMTLVKVRYDMESVPLVDRPNLCFWDDVKVWPPRALKDPPPSIMPSLTLANPRLPNAAPKVPTPVPASKPVRPSTPLPNSVVWKPIKRKDWEDSVSELTSVCTSAALRRYSGPSSKFVPPLSREYIRDRIDIDDPLRGYQIRHASGGWLQGFVLWTNFTTWTHYFTWDSLHPKCGLASSPYIKDADGTISKELETLPRTGDPSDSGIVFENIAEIALLGALGCGELLLRMALEDILKCPQYKYVILQATKDSRAFYERFGFQRVGAICRYANEKDATKDKNEDYSENDSSSVSAKYSAGNQSQKDDTIANSKQETPSKFHAVPTLDDPIQGYRHWTHANESQHSLDLHGGPSYMMCLKLPEEPIMGLNLLEKLASCFVAEKPSVESIGGASTPNSKRKLKRQSSTGSYTPTLPNISTSKPSPLSISEEWNNKRRKVSMDKLDIGQTEIENVPSFLLDQPLPINISPGMPPPSSSVATLKRGKAYAQLLAKAVANTTPKIPTAKSKTKCQAHTPPVSPEDTPATTSTQAAAVKGIQKVDRATLVKQKVKSYPRDREHFYNKVVQAKGARQGPYFFVLNYNDRLQMVTLCPMAPKGILSGKRHGRPRFQCVLNATSSNWVTAPANLYDPVAAFMVMKTPLVAQEAWDILGDT